MPAIEIRPDVYWIGVNDRTTDLFEGLWPITQEGVSYNAYLINDEKKALIDLSKSFKADSFFEQIADLTPLSSIDYIVLNHMEPDHTGVLKTLRWLAPNATILASKRAVPLIEAYYGITDNVRVVEEGETLSLGRRTLQFFAIPFVHWPETIATYETTQHILFPCDAFGGYGALRGGIFDDQCTDWGFYERESLRYYANIVASFSSRVQAAIQKLGGLQIDVIAPSHGLIWRHDPGRIVELYKKWAGYADGPAEPGVTLVYGSMYGNTEEMMNAVAQGISESGVFVNAFDATRTHVSYILPSLWQYAGVMVGAPTYEVALFPPVAYVLDMAARKHIYNKKVARFGSYGWSGGAQKEFERLIEPLKWELTETLEFRGGPTHEDLQQAEAFGRRFGEMIAAGAA